MTILPLIFQISMSVTQIIHFQICSFEIDKWLPDITICSLIKTPNNDFQMPRSISFFYLIVANIQNLHGMLLDIYILKSLSKHWYLEIPLHHCHYIHRHHHHHSKQLYYHHLHSKHLHHNKQVPLHVFFKKIKVTRTIWDLKKNIGCMS